MLSDPRAVLIAGPAGPIEVLFQEPEGAEDPRLVAVVAHPHPLHGGTMHTKVVHRVAKAFRDAGVPTLRFNFRGVGKSGGTHDEGRGEVDDFRAAVDEAARLRPAARIVSAGFSFGSRVSLLAAESDPRVVAWLGIGVPLRLYPDLPGALRKLTKPAAILQGTEDEFTSALEMRSALAEIARPPVLFDVEGDHFLDRGLPRIAELVPWFVGRILNERDSVDDRDPRL